MRFALSLLWSLVFLALTGCNSLLLQPDSQDAKLQEVEQRAMEAYQQENWQAAEKDYKYLTVHTADRFEPWFRLGNVYAQTKQFDAAIASYREALALEMDNSKAWHNLGVVQLRQATTTFLEMLENTEPGDPLRLRAKQMVVAVTQLMESGFRPQNTE